VGEQPRFIFATCQIGAEAALKAELAARWPEFRFAFSRPGFLTFKLPEDHTLEPGFDLHSVFARSFGFSLGGMRGDRERLIADFWQLAGKLPFCRIHVWQRDQHPPGEFDYEPALTELAREVHAALVRSCPRVLAPHAQRLDQPAERGELVLDCILVEPDYWWVGYHRVHDELSRWPGGLLAVELPADAVSRAWLKMEQALRWSHLPIAAGARVAELGSAPGGTTQCLLSRGYQVLGIDPAEMDPRVVAHPNFTHLRRRARQVRRREFRKVRWLLADMNVAPKCTLDAVEDIVTHREVNIRGLLLTLKLPDWKLAAKLPEYFARFARQLPANRREVSVAALQRPFRRKPPLGRRSRVAGHKRRPRQAGACNQARPQSDSR